MTPDDEKPADTVVSSETAEQIKKKRFDARLKVDSLPKSNHYKGNYIVLNKGSWIACRDTLLNTFKLSQDKNLLFTSPNIRNTADFILKIEDMLGLKTKTIIRRVFVKNAKGKFTRRKGIICFEVSPFWLSQKIRFSLFTLLCRCSNSYNRLNDNFSAALISHVYAKDTANAIQSFLKGNTDTQEVQNYGGWWAAFNNKTNLNRLKLPTKADKKAYFDSNE